MRPSRLHFVLHLTCVAWFALALISLDHIDAGRSVLALVVQALVDVALAAVSGEASSTKAAAHHTNQKIFFRLFI
jgi:uncharacterized membrane protein YwzB